MSVRSCFCVALLMLLPATVSAQHHHHHHHAHHHHHGSHYGYSNWTYVVPQSQQYSGAYYVQGNGFYYTPSAITYRGATQPGYAAPAIQQSIPLQFGGFNRCDDLTGRLESQINILCLELYYNYQHNPDFQQTYREAYGLLQLARELHALDHQGQRQAIQELVTILDQQYHHVQQDILPWTRQPYRHIPPGGAAEKAATGEALLHHLCFVAGVQPHTNAPVLGVEQAPIPR